jgi:hypothetical protein
VCSLYELLFVLSVWAICVCGSGEVVRLSIGDDMRFIKCGAYNCQTHFLYIYSYIII